MIFYRKAEKKDLNDIAALHIKCFEGYFLTKLGADLLAKYYGEYVESNQPFMLAFDSDIKENNGLVGGALCYYKGCNAKSDFEKNNRGALIKKVLGLCIRFDKDTWDRIWKKFFGKKKKASDEEKGLMDLDLLSIFVLPEYRGKGVSSNLLNNAIDTAKNESEKHIRYIVCYVDSNNNAGKKFYKKNGFFVYDHRGTQVIFMKDLERRTDFSNIIYREATEADARNIALLHERCFQGYFLTKLGTDLLEQYYLEYILQKQPFLVAEDPEQPNYGGLVSEILYYYKGCTARAEFERKNKKALAKKLFVLCLKGDRDAIIRCWAKVTGKFKRQEQSPDREYMDLDGLSQVLLPEYRGSGISSELHDRVIQWAKDHSDKPIHHIAYYINDDNPASIRLHEKNGCYLYAKRGHQLIYMKDV